MATLAGVNKGWNRSVYMREKMHVASSWTFTEGVEND